MEGVKVSSTGPGAGYISIDGRTHVGFAPGGFLAVFRGRECMRVRDPVAPPVDDDFEMGRRVVVGRRR